jgi:hypothetical protein
MKDKKSQERFESTDELVRFFADLVREPRRGVYKDIRFETGYLGPRLAFLAFLLGGPLGFGLGEKLRKRPSGIYVTVLLPTSLHVGFFARSRKNTSESDTGLKRHFFVDALDETVVNDYFDGALFDAVVSLSEQYTVEMTDESICFGPVSTPKQDAEMLARLVEAIGAVSEPPADNPEADESLFESDGEAVLMKVDSTVDADLAAVALEAEGIPVRFRGYKQGALFGDALGGFGGIAVLVPGSLKERAESILKGE